MAAVALGAMAQAPNAACALPAEPEAISGAIVLHGLIFDKRRVQGQPSV
jgi:hypothetical protein